MRAHFLLVILLAAALTAPPAAARIQPEFVCWASDMEFPVDCDDDED